MQYAIGKLNDGKPNAGPAGYRGGHLPHDPLLHPRQHAGRPLRPPRQEAEAASQPAPPLTSCHR